MAPKRAPQRLEWQGAFSSVAKPRSVLVTSAAAWRRLWRHDVGAQAPAVDFHRFVAAAVFLGIRPTGGYGVVFSTAVAVERGRAVIHYREKKPGRGDFVIESLTRPYGIRLYPKPRGKASIRKLP